MMDKEQVLILLPKYMTVDATNDGHFLDRPVNIDFILKLLHDADGSTYLPDRWFHIYNYLLNQIVTTNMALQWLDRLAKPGLAHHDTQSMREYITNQQAPFDYQVAWPVQPLQAFESTYHAQLNFKPITNDDVIDLYRQH